jgi:fumarylpyruvate hydrolase
MTDDAPAGAATRYVIAPPAPASLPVEGRSERFPVHRIYCVGRNYAAHAVEMGHDPDKEPPFFFQKNPDNLATDGADFPYPPRTSDVHHEVELVVALGRGGRDIAVADALAHVWGYAVGIDMTRRDLQGEAKKLGRPWEVAKAFEHSAPCGPLVPAAEIGHPSTGAIRLDIDGERRQAGDLDQMIWKVPEVVAALSALFALQPGDLIMTGTPAGVGPVHVGQRLHAHIDGVGDLKLTVTGG